MHILHVIQRYWPYVGGSERYFQELSERLAAQGHEVTVFTTTAWDLEYFWRPEMRHVDAGEVVHNGVRVARFPVRHLPASWLAYPGLRRVVMTLSGLPGGRLPALAVASATPLLPDLAFRLATTKQPFDLVHAGNIPFDAVVASAQAFARRRGIPFVMTPFTHLGEPGDDTVRRQYTMAHQIGLMRRSDAVIVQTALEAAFLAGAGVPRRALRRGGVGIEPDEISGGDGARFRAAHGVNGPLVYFIGTLAFDKGAVHLVEAMRRLWDDGSQAALALAGPAVRDFDRYFETLPEAVRGRILRLGLTIGDDKRDLLAAGDVFAMPSRTDSFGIVYLEAWCSGTPVIGARAGGVAEVIEDGTTGLLVPFGDVPALAAAIDGLLNDRDRARALGEAGRKKALNGYTWDKVVGRVGAIYDELMRGPK